MSGLQKTRQRFKLPGPLTKYHRCGGAEQELADTSESQRRLFAHDSENQNQKQTLDESDKQGKEIGFAATIEISGHLLLEGYRIKDTDLHEIWF